MTHSTTDQSNNYAPTCKGLASTNERIKHDTAFSAAEEWAAWHLPYAT